MARPIIIDTDPGQDDAVAILVALASPEELDVLAITAVAGNVPIDLTVINALALVELADRREVPVFRGSVRPMVKTLVTAEYVHGPTGLDGADLPTPAISESSGHAVDRIIEIVMGHDDITLCTLGPLTNVGLALVREPRIAGRVKELVMMGGGFFEGGNTTPVAEFNVFVDPHAAHVVFTSGIPIVMMPL
ncbi:MAG TPA: nucleoside hydrolase, partial [Acidimicrobiia bacterium]